MSPFRREDILNRLRAKVAAGQPIIGGGAGTGLSAQLEETGGIDLIVIYKTYPHIDHAERAEDLFALMERPLKGEIEPKMALTLVPVVCTAPYATSAISAMIKKWAIACAVIAIIGMCPPVEDCPSVRGTS